MTDLVFYIFVFLAIGVFFLFIHLLIGKLIRPDRPDAEKMTIYECGEPTVGSAWIQFDLRYYVVALLFVVFDVEVAFFFPWAVVFGKANELAKPDSALTQGRDRDAITQELAPTSLNLAYFESLPTAADIAKNAGGVPAGKKGGGKKGGGKKGGLFKKDGAGAAAPEAKAQDGGLAPKKNVAAAGMPPEAQGKIPVPVMMPGGGPGGMSPPPSSRAAPKPVAPISQETARTWAWIAFGDLLVFFGVLMVGFAYLWKRGDIDWVRSTAAEENPLAG